MTEGQNAENENEEPISFEPLTDANIRIAIRDGEVDLDVDREATLAQVAFALAQATMTVGIAGADPMQ